MYVGLKEVEEVFKIFCVCSFILLSRKYSWDIYHLNFSGGVFWSKLVSMPNFITKWINGIFRYSCSLIDKGDLITSICRMQMNIRVGSNILIYSWTLMGPFQGHHLVLKFPPVNSFAYFIQCLSKAKAKAAAVPKILDEKSSAMTAVQLQNPTGLSSNKGPSPVISWAAAPRCRTGAS